MNNARIQFEHVTHVHEPKVAEFKLLRRKRKMERYSGERTKRKSIQGRKCGKEDYYRMLSSIVYLHKRLMCSGRWECSE